MRGIDHATILIPVSRTPGTMTPFCVLITKKRLLAGHLCSHHFDFLVLLFWAQAYGLISGEVTFRKIFVIPL